jgi:hypothetical protein
MTFVTFDPLVRFHEMQLTLSQKDQDIAFLLMGFNIILSEDKAEVVQIVTYYTWLLEGG